MPVGATEQKLSYKKLNEIIRVLDLYSRIYIGQYNEILFRITGHVTFPDDKTELREAFCDLREVFIKGLPRSVYSSLGIWGEDTPMVAIRAYDIQQCLRYQLAYYKSEGKTGVTVNFRVPYIHGEWGMTPKEVRKQNTILEKLGLYPDFHTGYMRVYMWNCPVIITKFEEDGAIVQWNKEVARIVKDALEVEKYVSNGQLAELFAFVYPEIDADSYKSLCERAETCLKNLLREDLV